MVEYILALRLNGWQFYGLFLQPEDGESTFFRKVSKYILSQITRFMSRGFFSRFTYLLTYLFTPWSRVLLEELTCSQLVKKFPTFYGIRWFITAVTSAHQQSLF